MKESGICGWLPETHRDGISETYVDLIDNNFNDTHLRLATAPNGSTLLVETTGVQVTMVERFNLGLEVYHEYCLHVALNKLDHPNLHRVLKLVDRGYIGL